MFLGARISINVPDEGYVGVGEVETEKTPVTSFEVIYEDGVSVNILEADLDAERMDENTGDPKNQEHLVGVDWKETRPINQAYWETGRLANQNTVTKLRNQFTLERLYEEFDFET